MNLTDTIFARRAIRSYLPEPVDAQTVQRLLRAAVQAPSAMNRQPWLFSIVQSRAQLKRYSDHAKRLLLEQAAHDPKVAHYAERFRDEAFNIFYDAATLVVIGAAERSTYTDADCWLAASHLMLAACDAGLGTCCIGFAVNVLNLPEVKAELGLPPAGVAVSPVIVGSPAAAVPPVPRNEPTIAAWIR